MMSDNKHNIRYILSDDSDIIHIDESFSKKTLEEIISEIDNQEDNEVMFTDIKY